jgi:flagellar FliL protein
MTQVQGASPDDVSGDGANKGVAGGSVRSKKKLIIIGAAAAILLLGGGGAAYAVMGGGSHEAAEGDGDAEGHGAEKEGPDTFIEVPPMTVNLRSADGTPRFLRVHLMLVPTSPDKQAEITTKLPLIIDSYQPFLRELRPEDIAGSAAAFRLKEEMLIRANRQVGKGSVADVLIQDLVQQ